MCVVCGVPLNEATDAPQANRERAEIRRLIARGETKAQVKRALARHLEVSAVQLTDYCVDRHANGNLTVRPEAVYG